MLGRRIMVFGVGLHLRDGMATPLIILMATVTLFWQSTATTIASRRPVLCMINWILLKAKAPSSKSIFLEVRDIVGTVAVAVRMAMRKKLQDRR